MGDEKHPNQEYADSERLRAPRGMALPPQVSATAHAPNAQEGQSLGAADVGVATTGTGEDQARDQDTPDFESMDVSTLEGLADKHDVTVKGSGANGNVVKKDLVSALDKHYQEHKASWSKQPA